MHARQADAQPSGRSSNALAAALVSVPDVLLLPALWLSITISLAITTRTFSPWIVLPVALVASVFTWRWRPARLTVQYAWQGSVAALVIIAAWLAVNLPFASQWVVADRDPGFLTLEGIWLTSHTSPDIPVGSAAEIARNVPGATVSSLAYFLQDDTLHAQGAKLLPGLLASVGWFGGIHGVLVGGLLVGAVALLFFYGMARRVVGPLWALAALAALAFSLAFTGLSRSAYTEPLVLALTFGGLTMLWVAFGSRRWYHFAAGGALVGAGGMARIDGAALVVGLILGTALAVFANVRLRSLHNHRPYFLITAGAAIVTTVVGIVDLAINSPGYLSDLSSQFKQLVIVTIASLIFGLLITMPWPWRKLRVWILRRRQLLGWSAFAVTLVVAALLISRPLWYTAHNNEANGPVAGLIAGMQSAQGLQVDPTRSYDEHTVNWIAWYYGWVAVLLGFAGLATAFGRSIARRDPRLLVVLAVVGSSSVLYLVQVNISPDQIWGIRRLLPVTIPGFLLFAVWLLSLISAKSLRLRTRMRVGTNVVIGILTATIVIFPLSTWGNMFNSVEHGGSLPQANAVCSAIPGDRVVYVQDKGANYLPTLRTMCDISVIQFAKAPTKSQLSKVRELWGDKPIPVVSFNDTVVPWSKEPETPHLISSIETWPNVLETTPKNPVNSQSNIWIGIITKRGSVQPYPLTK